MRTLIVTEFITVDGVIDSPGGGSHPRAGWTFKDVPFVAEAYEIKGREQVEAGAMLMGRISYDEFAPIWPTMDEFAEYNAMPKYVVSNTLTDPEWNNTSVSTRSTTSRPSSRPTAATSSCTAARRSPRASPPPVSSTDTTCSSSRCCSVTASGSSAGGDTTTKLDVVEHETYSNGVVKVVYDVVR